VILTPSQTVSAEKIRIQGTAEPKSTVAIDGGLGDIVTGEADVNGNYDIEVMLNKDAVNTLSVTSTDDAGNLSDATTLDIIQDSTPPDAPIISTESQSVNLEKIKVTGTAEPLSEITIKGGLNQDVTGSADENGDYDIDVPLEQNEINTLEVTAKDSVGNVSEPSTVDITEDSIIDKPTITTPDQAINSDVITITGNTEPLSEVTITGGLGDPITSDADENGDYSIDVPLKQDALNVLKVKAKDVAGNISDETTVTITEDSSTIKPTIIKEKQKIIEDKIHLRGKAESNATITIEGCVDEPVTGTADSDGNYDIEVGINADETKRLRVTSTDELGNVSETLIVDFADMIRGILAPDKLNIIRM
jgi:hypothetical protein